VEEGRREGEVREKGGRGEGEREGEVMERLQPKEASSTSK
jgi:hypothetical protein